jgi:hypothetical protein
VSVEDLLPFYEERFQEVNAYLDLLEEIQKATQDGVPRIAGSNYRITAPQQKILYSSVYLQLYNLVEATISRCIDAVTHATRNAGQWQPHELNEDLQREWVRAVARTHVDMTPEKRLKFALQLSNHITNQLPINDFVIDTGGGGNWDDDAIFKVGKRVGCRISVSPAISEAVKRHVRDEVGALKLVKNRRNSLAHGSISFVDCADGVAVSELRETSNNVGDYLREVIGCFVAYIETFDFLHPDSRPNRDAV